MMMITLGRDAAANAAVATSRAVRRMRSMGKRGGAEDWGDGGYF